MNKNEKEKVRRRRTVFFSGSGQDEPKISKRSLGIFLLTAVCLLLTLIIVPKGGFIPDYYSSNFLDVC